MTAARKFALAAVAACILAALLVVAALRASLPIISGTLEVSGPDSEISIDFDQWQRPYVQAKTLPDALFAEGWLHAEHRLWQMELFRRAGSGRLAELMGEDMLEADRELWRFGVPQLALQLERNASQEMTALVDAYVAGVNASLAGHKIPPPEFLLLGHRAENWQRKDVYALGALMAFQSGNNFRNELLRLALRAQLSPQRFGLFLTDNSSGEDFPFVLPADNPAAAATVSSPVFPDLGAEHGLDSLLVSLDRISHSHPTTNPLMPRLGFGSNGWVVAPQKSGTGKALYAFDSHDELGLPNLFYEVHLFFGEGRQIRGWSVAGLPGVINGFNENIAWGFTNIGDTQDLFLETRHPDNPRLFLDGREWYEPRMEVVSIPVRGRSEPEQLRILHTRNGPLIDEDLDLSLSWTAHHIGQLGLDSVLAFNQARNWVEFNAALDRHAAPTLNATYADIHGTIGFRTAGILPRRGDGEGLFPLRGDQPTQRWQGFVAPADMPRSTNPARGFLAAANARVHPRGSYPLVSADNAAPYRIQRLQRYLEQADKVTIADMQALQMDWHDGQAAQLLPDLLAGIARSGLSAPAGQALQLLESWSSNPVASRDSGAALIFQQWYREIAGAVFADALGGELYGRLLRYGYPLNHALDTLIDTGDFDEWWRGKPGAILARALETTVEKLSIAPGGGPGNWRLDQRQQVGLQHELSKAIPQLENLFASPPRPWGGSPASVGRASYRYYRPFHVTHGATVRAVAEMGEVPAVQSVIPGGQSGHPLSPHYDDQFTPWREGRLLPIGANPTTQTRSNLKLLPAR